MLLCLERLEAPLDLFFALIRTLHRNLGEVMPDCVCKWIWRNHSSPLCEWANWSKKLLMKEFQHFVFSVASWDTSKTLAHTISKPVVREGNVAIEPISSRQQGTSQVETTQLEPNYGPYMVVTRRKNPNRAG